MQPDTAQMRASMIEQVLVAVAILVPVIVLLLVLSTLSWIEPVLFIAAIGVSILINMGTNIAFGEVSFVTFSVSPILQLAVSLDYAIFLLHAFAAERGRTSDVAEAMARAMRASMPTIAASATTTLFGFAALAFMQFQIGADLGINLVKGIVLSFVTVMALLPALTLLLYRIIDKDGPSALAAVVSQCGSRTAQSAHSGFARRARTARARVPWTIAHSVQLSEQRSRSEPARRCRRTGGERGLREAERDRRARATR